MRFKDASDMLQAGRIKDVCVAVYDAKAWRPDGVLSFGDLKARIKAKLPEGAPWPWASLTKATYGRRPGEVYGLGAGTGVGKTDVFTQTIMHDAVVLNIRCGVIYLEQPVAETGRRIAGKLAGKRFHIPDGSWAEAELDAAVDQVDATDNVHLYEAFGSSEWDVIKARMRYMILGLGCRHIFLDHLTALAASAQDEQEALKRIMAEMAALAQETGAIIHFISHLATPEGKPHEEGGRVMAKHFKGSRAIAYWSHFMIGLERDSQAEDLEARATTTLRVLKDRNTGNANGFTMGLRYDQSTGILHEAPLPEKKEPTRRGGDHSDF